MADTLRLLEGMVVVDLGVGMSCALVTKFLADAGARVVRVEPRGGDPFSQYYPAYEVWRRGSQLERAAERNPARLTELLDAADVCVVGGEDYPGLERRKDAAAIAAARPHVKWMRLFDLI